MTEHVRARFAEATDVDAIRGRYGPALANGDVDRVAAHADASVLVVDRAPPPALRRLLEGAGAAIADAGDVTLIAVTRAALQRALARASGDDVAVVESLLTALARTRALAPALRLRDRVLDLRDRAVVMGIVNVTPDSFYERVDGAASALDRARAMAACGAALIDVGGRSYAAGNALVEPDEERARVVPAIRAVRDAGIDVAISVDTVRPSVAEAALAAGAHLVNDCSGLADAALAGVVAAHGAGLVVMHIKGRLNVREPSAYVYRDVMAEIVDFLYERTERAVAAGVARDAIAVDPGLEFGKEPGTDLEILARFGELRALGYPIVLASSRKSFMSRIFGTPARELLVPSLAAAAAGIAAGARLLRVHDVGETVQLARMLGAIAAATRPFGERF